MIYEFLAILTGAVAGISISIFWQSLRIVLFHRKCKIEIAPRVYFKLVMMGIIMLGLISQMLMFVLFSRGMA